MKGRWSEAGWQADITLRSAQLAELRRLAATVVDWPSGITIDGKAPRVGISLRGTESLQRVAIDADLVAVAAANEEGTVATDQLSLQLSARARRLRNGWSLETTLASGSGRAYVDPVFLDLGVNPGELRLVGRLHDEWSRLSIERLEFDLHGIAGGMAAGELDLKGETLLQTLHLDLAGVHFPGVYTAAFRPLLGATVLRDLETSGSVSGRVEIENGSPALLQLRIDNVSAESADERIAVRGLRGNVNWQSALHGVGGTAGQSRTSARDATTAASIPASSRLSWTSANLYGITGDAAQIRFAAVGAGFRILEPTDLPILDGGLAVDTLELGGIGTPGMSLRFDARLRPISMAKLSSAFGWPQFAGTLSGRIPQVSLDRNVLKFGGNLEAEAFGGSIVVNGLQLRDPLGKYPRLNANATLRGLDLAAVTGTFEFGTITGRLDGEIRDLELFRWAPVKFDARFYTPRKDRSRHIISQRAVRNLSNIGGGGGGVAAALSSGFLRFFDNFRYNRLGLSCRLENEVCYMDGIEPAGSGTAYYIVRGSGIPRIDIIGNAHRVSWRRLVNQLQAIQSSAGPEVRR